MGLVSTADVGLLALPSSTLLPSDMKDFTGRLRSQPAPGPPPRRGPGAGGGRIRRPGDGGRDLTPRQGRAPLGPFQTFDIVGLTTAQNVFRAGGEQDRKLAAWLKTDHIDQGKLGPASGEGFHEYSEWRDASGASWPWCGAGPHTTPACSETMSARIRSDASMSDPRSTAGHRLDPGRRLPEPPAGTPGSSQSPALYYNRLID